MYLMTLSQIPGDDFDRSPWGLDGPPFKMVAKYNRKDRYNNIKDFSVTSVPKFSKSRDLPHITGTKKRILNLFSNPYDSITSSTVQEKLNLSQGTAWYHIEGKNSLQDLGLIYHVPRTYPKLFMLTRTGIIYFSNFISGVTEFSNQLLNGDGKVAVRGHNIGLKTSVTRMPDELFISKSHFHNVEKDYDMGWCRYQFRFSNHYVLVTPRSIIFKPAEVYGKPYQVLFQVYDVARRVYQFLEEDNVGLKISDDNTFILSQEYAFEHDAFAVACRKLGQEIKTARFKVDMSKGFPELEFIHPDTACDDADAWKNHNEVMTELVIDGKVDPHKLTVRNLGEVDQLLLKMSEQVKSTVESVDPVVMGGLTLSQTLLRALSHVDNITQGLKPLRSGGYGVGTTPPSEKPVEAGGGKFLYDRDGFRRFMENRGRKWKK